MSAALAARAHGRRVLLLERAPYPERGGNTAFTGGLMRFAYESTKVIRELVPDLSEDQLRDGRVCGVRFEQDRRLPEAECDAVVLASGGFQANAAWRTSYLGPGWDLAKVRGTRYDTGDGIEMALAIGASPAGNWSGGHAVAWELNAPEFGDKAIGDAYQKHSYPLGIVVNLQGLTAAGELVGGLFYFNYPGGAGLSSGTVFGRTAGSTAARGD